MKKLSFFTKGIALAFGVLMLGACAEENAIMDLAEDNFTKVGQTTIKLEQEPTNDYSAVTFELDVEGIAAALGCDLADIRLAALSEDKTNFDVESTAGNGGFWFNAEGNVIGWGENAAFFVEPENADTLTVFRVGQFPEALVPFQKVSTDIYLLYEKKYYLVKVVLDILEPEVTGIDALTKAGEVAIELEQEPTTNYATLPFTVDIAAIAEALGCEVADVKLGAIDADRNIAGSTANAGGYWLTKEGIATSWNNNSALFIEPDAEGDLANLHAGQFPEAYSAGDVASATVYFLGGDKYYELNVTIKIVAPKVVENFTSVYEQTITLSQSVNNSYAWSKGEAIFEQAGLMLGTNDWKVYGLANVDEEGNLPEGAAKYTKVYTCDPNPGFWLSKDGLNCGWGENAYFGVAVGSVEEGKVTMIQFPERCNVGDTFKTQVFLVNEDDGNMITINIVYNVIE